MQHKATDEYIINGILQSIQRLVPDPTSKKTTIQGLPIPSSRLQLDNQLFIEKTYLGTKRQQYSLNSKLRDLKKDYNQLQDQIVQIQKMRQTPRRSFSRKSREQNRDSKKLAQKQRQTLRNNENTSLKAPSPKLPSFTYDKKYLEQDRRKRESWFKGANDNILQHSQLDHIFNNKLNKIYDLDDIRGHNLPKPEIAVSQSFVDGMKPKPQNFVVKQRSRPNMQEKKDVTKVGNGQGANGAIGRRQKAKNTIEFRRKKLEQLLRTLW